MVPVGEMMMMVMMMTARGGPRAASSSDGKAKGDRACDARAAARVRAGLCVRVCFLYFRSSVCVCVCVSVCLRENLKKCAGKGPFPAFDTRLCSRNKAAYQMSSPPSSVQPMRYSRA